MEPDDGRPREDPETDPLDRRRHRRHSTGGRITTCIGLVAVAAIAVVPVRASRAQDTWPERADQLIAQMNAPGGRAALVRALTELEPTVTVGPGEPVPYEWALAAVAYVRLSGVIVEHAPDSLPAGVTPTGQCEQACAVADAYGKPVMAAYARLMLGRTLKRESRHTEATEVFEGALADFPDDVYSRPDILLNLATIAGYSGQFGWAGDLVGRAREALDALPSEYADLPRLRCIQKVVEVDVAFGMGLPDVAAEAFEEEERLAAGTGDPGLIAGVMVHRAELDLAAGRYVALERHVTQALEAWPAGAPARKRERLLICRALGHSSSGRSDPAHNAEGLAFLDEFLSIADLVPTTRLRALNLSADLALREGELDAAERTLGEARELLAALSGDDASSGPLLDGAVFATMESRLTIARTDDPALLAEQLGRLEAAVDRFLAQWRSTPIRKGGVGFLHYARRRVAISELIRLTLLVHVGEPGTLRALEHLHRVQALGSLPRGAGYEPVPFEELRETLLRAGQGMLVYMPGPDRGHVFAFDREHAVHEPLERSGVLRDGAKEFRSGLFSGGDLSESGARLIDALVPGEARALADRWAHWTIVAVDLIGYVPFEALPDGSGATMGDRVALDYLPSLAVGAVLERREVRKAHGELDLVLVVAPTIDESVRDSLGLPEIPFGERERRMLTGAFARDRVRVLTAGDATRKCFGLPGLRDARMLHFVTHGAYDAGRERSFGFLLTPMDGDDGFVWCEDIEGRSMPPLVVVSACQAASGPIRSGDGGAADLSGAFLAAGARVVLISPNQLEYGALLDLLEIFQERLVTHGESPAEALHVARRTLTAEGRAHPHHALIHLVGLGNEPVFR